MGGAALSCGAAAAQPQPPSLFDSIPGAPPLQSCFAGLALGAAQQPPAAVVAAAPEAVAPPPPPAPPPPVMTECCVCMEDAKMEDLLLLWPCAHRCVCQTCADALMLRPLRARLCPKCRKPAMGAARVFDN
jgi:hypothetical protein